MCRVCKCTKADCDHPSRTIEERLRDLGDRDYIYAGRGGVLTVESIAYRQFPDIDIERFADCLADRLFRLEDAVRDYLAAGRNHSGGLK